jgi:hypothetical protein
MHRWLGAMPQWCLAPTLFLFYAYFKPFYLTNGGKTFARVALATLIFNPKMPPK